MSGNVNVKVSVDVGVASAWPMAEATAYAAHPLHKLDRAFPESNCYVDLWVEILHARGLDPSAMLGFVLATDLEVDQWTFYKPPHEDLAALYGVEVRELTIFRPLLEHAEEQLRGGRLVLSEIDAWFLPDTAATDYRKQHTKTTIGLHTIDRAARSASYFHNGGYYRLEGEDFDGIFAPPTLPLFAELARFDREAKRSPIELARASKEMLARHLARRPRENPMPRFRARFEADLERLRQEGVAAYHQYAFATVRQLGSAFEFGASYVRWLGDHGEAELEPVAADLDGIAAGAKVLLLKGARSAATKKPADVSAVFADLEARWASAMERLVSRFASSTRAHG